MMQLIGGIYSCSTAKYRMTTCADIITLALSKLGVAGGLKPPSQPDLDLGLTTLMSLYRQMISSGKLGRARPVSPTDDYSARENDRIFRTSDFTGTIQLPEIVTDTWHGEFDDDRFYDRYPAPCHAPRPPRDGAFVIINDAVSGNTAEFIYEGYINQWVSIHDLNLGNGQNVTDAQGDVIEVIPPSVPPLSFRDANGLAAYLATMLADHYGETPSALTMRDANAWQAALINGFGEPSVSIRTNFF